MPKIEMQASYAGHVPGSTPGVDRRFNERDIRLHPELRTLAYRYVRAYHGTFEPILAAQELLHQAGHLPDPVIKMALNTAYSDPSVHFRSVTDDGSGYEEFFENSPSDDNVVEFPQRPIVVPEPDPDPVLEEERWRAFSIRTPARIKAPYGMSSFNGKVLHRVDPYSRHYVEWRSSQERSLWDRREGLPEDMPRDQKYLHVYWQCSNPGGTANPYLYKERPEGVPYCRGGCFSKMCPKCVKMVHLDPNAGPEDPIGPCPRCGGDV